MDVYDTNAAHSVSDDGTSNCEEVITRIVTDLFSYDDTRRKRIFDHYYFPNATFTSPILRTEGVHNIKQHQRTLGLEDTQQRAAADKQHLLQWKDMCSLPVTVVLEFRETDKDSGLLKIETHQEQWTIEGVLKAIPFVSFWYDHVVRTMIGKLLSATGEAVYTATETASLLVLRSKEIEEAKRRLESGAYVVIDDNDDDIDQGRKQEQVMMLRIKNSSFSSTASCTPQW
ncbi:hypothetical protein MAM1_0206d07976 [Mucor ambiguus]|uniref:Uncharacterized protein n=1 Tax=Mucor ambiguus TaxID=91626 RepID=A0A0C9MLN9_9FUNG|nr:hypothetical protein MAM1_0206d07976 [Mucor ambiguus]